MEAWKGRGKFLIVSTAPLDSLSLPISRLRSSSSFPEAGMLSCSR
jgi:hypothetical protein